MKPGTRRILTLLLFLGGTLVSAAADYSSWSFFGGLNLIYNSDDAGITEVPGMNPDGTPGGLASAPSPLPAFAGAEYRYLATSRFIIAPSVSLWTAQYAFARDRALPTEIENRTAFVSTIYLDIPFLVFFEHEKVSWTLGIGPGIVARYALLEPGIPADAINVGETLSAGEQVAACNDYFWNSLRWLYPSIQTGVRYRLQTGWGAGLTVRAGIPLFNLWAKPEVPFVDSFMVLAALTVTPPAKKRD
ncbi:MAG TPA: hypothetical protein PKH40_05905 [Treponemataceae bacterium]|nr:MAG: hypothetical protein EWM51_06970 [Treponema sp.]HOC29191.1 hypothetical protein [Treponemataceae bacterium]HPX48103.1 hypothetical protein [Treponemataceae bacterium]HQL32019.1 hypothetical protein [Treponemataceae bacterium]